MAGTPGAWRQITPAAVNTDPAAGTFPAGYLILNVADGGLSWKVEVGAATSSKVAFHGAAPTAQRDKWADVDLKAGFLSVETAKTGERVDIPIFPMLAEELAKAKAKAGMSPARGSWPAHSRAGTSRWSRSGGPS